MELDRKSIIRSDFPNGRPGWKPAAVEAHLEQIADAVSAAQLEPGASLSRSLSGRIEGILEAANTAATEIKREARAEAESIREEVVAPAHEHRTRVVNVAQALVAHVETIEAELAALFADLRVHGQVIGEAMTALELVVAEPPPSPSPSPSPSRSRSRSRSSRSPSARSPGQSPPTVPVALGAPDVESSESTARKLSEAPSAEPQTPAAADRDAARLVALDMALSGDSRAEIDSYLADHFALTDRSALVDEVLAASEV